jgi:hypothetical protein
MTDEHDPNGGTNDGAKPDPAPDGAKPPTPSPDDDKPDLGEAGKRAIASERQAKRDAEKRAKQAEDQVARMREALDGRQQTEQEAQAQAASALSEVRRLRVAMKHNLPTDLAARLIGETEDELDEDAKRLLALVKPAKPKSDAGAGTGRSDGTEPSSAEVLRAAFGRGG